MSYNCRAQSLREEIVRIRWSAAARLPTIAGRLDSRTTTTSPSIWKFVAGAHCSLRRIPVERHWDRRPIISHQSWTFRFTSSTLKFRQTSHRRPACSVRAVHTDVPGNVFYVSMTINNSMTNACAVWWRTTSSPCIALDFVDEVFRLLPLSLSLVRLVWLGILFFVPPKNVKSVCVSVCDMCVCVCCVSVTGVRE